MIKCAKVLHEIPGTQQSDEKSVFNQNVIQHGVTISMIFYLSTALAELDLNIFHYLMFCELHVGYVNNI